jgi:hypothetical protein
MAMGKGLVSGVVWAAVGGLVVVCSGCDTGSNGSDGDKRIFVTSVAYTGALGGLSGADEECNNVAGAAALGGTWTAWLSDRNTAALDRIADVGPWYLIDEATVVFNNKPNLTTTPIVAIAVDEHGRSVLDATAWTGTAVGGLPQGSGDEEFCACTPSEAGDWMWEEGECIHHGGIAEVFPGTGTVGAVSAADNAWTSSGDLPCNQQAHLYCIEQ